MFKRSFALLLAMVLALGCLTGACAEPEDAAGALALQPGDALHGFTVTEAYDSSTLNSTIYTFTHEVSGATLVYVKNDDPNVAFAIGYRTPYVDETDTNHVFEHAILSGSAKYPSKNLYIDLLNKAYQTYVNAHTAKTVTWYPVASQSEEQLYKLADVYMSCMVAPVILEDENIFKREAVRFELDDPDGDIAINGTVFTEDSGCLTDKTEVCTNNLLDALYPGETAANMIGRAEWHYDDLTYEHTVETYERCYHFDNSLIFLYGDLDLDRFLGFLDEEYLSKYPAQGTDLSAWQDGPTAPGFVDVRKPIPAYEGDTVEGNSVIEYAIDLDGATDVQLEQYNLFAYLLNWLGSPLYNLRTERGIENSVSVDVRTDGAKPLIVFTMDYADPDQKDDLKSLAEDALKQVAAEGFDPAMLEMVVKIEERGAKMTRNDTNVGINIVYAFLGQWARSGDPNCYRVFEQALGALVADSQQQTVRQMALNLLTPRRSALVTNVPTPGLAEEHDEALADYLKDMKAGMTDEEIAAMVEETAAFNAWNAEEQPNNDFLIAPEALPDPSQPEWTKSDVDGVTVYRGDGGLSGVGQYAVFFDLSGMSREEIEYLMLTGNYLLQMDTTEHSADELYRLFGEYVSGGGSSLVYPGAMAGEYHRPMLYIIWSSLTEDFDTSLDLILELYTQTDYSDPDMLTYLTNMSADYWDKSRQDPNGIASLYAHCGEGLFADSNRFNMDVDGQDCYYLLTDAVRRLQEEEGFAQEWAARLDNAVSKAFTRENLIFMCVADDAESDAIIAHAVERLNALPEKEGADAEYALPDAQKNLAICVESSINDSFLVADYLDDEGFEGRYLPFWYALSNLYTVPTFRFKLGVYTAYNYYEWSQSCLSTMIYSDPNSARTTVEALAQMPQALYDMELTEESLDGYILSAYSAATGPQGVLNEVMNAMILDVYGADAERILAIKRGIRDATLEDRAEAVEHIIAALEDASYCMAGNEGLIRADADCFDEVISWRHGDAGD